MFVLSVNDALGPLPLRLFLHGARVLGFRFQAGEAVGIIALPDRPEVRASELIAHIHNCTPDQRRVFDQVRYEVARALMTHMPTSDLSGLLDPAVWQVTALTELPPDLPPNP
jgi:hypothetical protein